MKLRDYLFEFEDQPWFPAVIREGMTDYLRYMLTGMKFYTPIIPLIIEGLDQTNCNQLIDLCSGGGGVAGQIKNSMEQELKNDVRIMLTDKYPNNNAFGFLAEKTNGTISFSPEPVDATNVPESLKGFRTIFSSFHHFDTVLAKAVIKNAIDARAGIGIFDGGDRNVFIILGILIVQPLTFFFFTPFFKPFRLSRIIFTYLIPIIPFCTIWDGIVSIIRLYSPQQLLAIARQVESKSYTWKAGKVKNKLGMNVTYLTGYPSSGQAFS